MDFNDVTKMLVLALIFVAIALMVAGYHGWAFGTLAFCLVVSYIMSLFNE